MSGNVSLTNAPVVTVTNAPNANGTRGTMTVNGVVSGAGFTKAGGGTMVLTNAANAITGTVGFAGGILNINSLATLGTANALTFTGGTLQYASTFTGANDISAYTVTLGAGGGTLDTGAQNVVLANSIGNGGTGGFTKAGSGNLTLGPANNFSGAFTINGGIVSNFSNVNQLGTSNVLNIGAGTLQYVPGNTLDITSLTLTSTNAAATVDVNGNSLSLAHTIGGTAGIQFSSTAGPANVTLTIANQATGPVIAGANVTLILGNANALQNGAIGTNPGGNLSLGSITTLNVGGISGAGNLPLVNSLGQNVTLILGSTGGTFTGVLSDNGSNLPVTKVGTGTQIFDGSTVTAGVGNTYNGDTVVNGGTFEVNFTAPSVQLTDILYSQVAANQTLQGTEGRLVMGGGTFFETNRTNNTTLQQFGSTLINMGSSQISMAGRSSGSKPELLLYTIARNNGATVDFTPSSGNGSGAFTTTLNGPSGILGGYATFNNGAEWARETTGNSTLAGGGVNILGGATYTNSFANNTINTDLTANLVAPANATTGSVRFASPIANPTLTLTGNNVIATGGILMTTTTSNHNATINSTNPTDTLTSGNGTDLIVLQYDASATLTIASNIVDAAGPIALTKAGNGTLIVSGNNTFTGGVFLNMGNLQLGSAVL